MRIMFSKIWKKRDGAGMLALFQKPYGLIQAAKVLKERKATLFDCFTPYPIHGLDQAMGLPRSRIPLVTLVFGLTGCTLGFYMQYWMSVIDWPIIIGGKPFNSWPAFIPITFECTILLGGLATAAALFAICRLPNFKVKILDPELTNNRFAIFISKQDKTFHEGELRKLFTELGAYEVRLVE